MTKNNFFRFFFVTLALILVSGCLNFSRNRLPEKRNYQWDVRRQANETTPATNTTVKVRPLSISKSYEGKGFVYRFDSGETKLDYYNEFAINPHLQITELLEKWFSDGTVFATLLPQTSQIKPHYIIEGRISELYGDFRESDQGYAVVTIQLILIEFDSEGLSRFVMNRNYHQRIPLSRRAPAALLEAWNVGLEKIFENFEQEIIPLLK